MSDKCGEYDKAMTYFIWVCCASRKGKLDFTLVVFPFNDLLVPFDAGDPVVYDSFSSLPVSPTFFSSSLAPTTSHEDLQWRLGRNVRGDERWLCTFVSESFILFLPSLHCFLNLMGSFKLRNTTIDSNVFSLY